MKKIWTYEIKGARSVSQRAPIIFEDRVIVTMNHGQGANFQGTIVALDLDTGAELWRYDLPHFFTRPVMDSDGSILVSNFNGAAYKLSAQGEMLWKAQASERNLWAGVMQAGKFIFPEIAGGSKFTWAVNVQSGKIDWQYEHGGHSYGLVTDNAQSAFTSSYSGSFDKQFYSLHAVDIATGKRQWKTAHPDILFQPSTYQDFLVTGSRGAIASFSQSTGELVAKLDAKKDHSFEHPAVTYDDRVIMASDKGHILALKMEQKRTLFGKAKHSLSVIWDQPLDSDIEYFTQGINGLLALTKSGHLYKINSEDGFETAKLKLPNYVEGKGVTEIEQNKFILAINRSCSRFEA